VVRSVKPIDALRFPAAERLRRVSDEATDLQLAGLLARHDGLGPVELAAVLFAEFFGPVGEAIQDLLNEYAEAAA